MYPRLNDRPLELDASRPLPGRIGWWRPGREAPGEGSGAIARALHRLAEPVIVVQSAGGPAVARGGTLELSGDAPERDLLPVLAVVPALPTARLGDPSFLLAHSVRAGYVTGAMANGIASVEIVTAISRAGYLGIFGSAGLSRAAVERAVSRLGDELGRAPFGVNLIHSPNEPSLEEELVDLYLARGVRLIEASAFLDLTPSVVRYRARGLRRAPDGSIEAPHQVIAKISRTELATKFLSPPPERILRGLLERGQLTPEEVELARKLPVAGDVTVEADSGGHTDNRPLVTLLPSILALRDRLQSQHGYATPPRVGAAGGIATPASAAAAFAMGAGYVVTGSINQACVESGSSDAVRALLAEADLADVTMAPAADMFEMGVKVQVLKRGTMFALRAAKLHELYRAYSAWEAIPETERANVERNFLRASFAQVWAETRDFFLRRDPSQVDRAEKDSRHKLALVFRWYLGLSSRWANSGDPSRKLDYQVWCGPSMGAFNEWARGSFLEVPGRRRVAEIARNLLHGAAFLLRTNLLATQGVFLPPEISRASPLEPTQLDETGDLT